MSKTVLVIDNYDSFTYNLVNYLKRAGADKVYSVRNDKITIEKIRTLSITHIVISPGPGNPNDAGISMEVIRAFSETIPILGVCLGLQCIVQAFGGKIVQAEQIMHGKLDTIFHDSKRLYRTFTAPFSATRYHSLCAEISSMPECLEITASSNQNEIMGVRHTHYAIEGVQFHPESIGTEDGLRIIRSFLDYRVEEHSIKNCLMQLAQRKQLGYERASFVAKEISNGVLKDTQVAALIMGITSLGITEDDIVGFANAFLEKAITIPLSEEETNKTIDIVGTGGDGLKTCNISTLSSIVLAAYLSPQGYKIAKHGNRSVSSSSGSSDVLAALGYPLNIDPKHIHSILNKHGFGFLFAPLYHGAFKNLAQVRKDIGAFTIMNFLGPLINPASISTQLLGVSQESMCEPMLKAALQLGRKKVWVVRGENGMDEISVCSPSKLYSENNGVITHETLIPSDFGVRQYDIQELTVRDQYESATLARECLQGKAPDAIMDAISVNAGTAHALATTYSVNAIKESVQLLREFLYAGQAWNYFDNLVKELQKDYIEKK